METNRIARVMGLLAAVLAVPVALAAGGPVGDTAAGRALYDQHCAICHGPTGKGDGPLADELKVQPANLTLFSQRRGGTFPEVEAREIIDGRRKVRGHGGPEMPIWGRVFARGGGGGPEGEAAADVKLDALVDWLRSVQVGPAKVVSER